MKHHRLLNILIFVGLLAGVIVGFLLYNQYKGLSTDEIEANLNWLYETGSIILIRPLKMMIIPLVFTSVVVGITSIGDPNRLGLLGGTTLVYYFATMLIAVIIGATLVTTIQPGDLDAESKAAMIADYQEDSEQAEESRKKFEDAPKELGGAWLNIVKQMIPDNALRAAVNGQPLPVIAFSILFGLALMITGERAKPVVKFMDALFSAVMTMVGWIIWITPIGVFLLVAWTIGKLGGAAVERVALYMMTVFIGLAIHGFIVLPTILFVFGRANPFKFMWRMRPALMTAFGTDSSSATLPVTIETAETVGGCSKRASGFVLPLGSTINMDGTALYEAVAVIFLFQLHDIQLGFAQLAVVALTATLAAVGAAGIPSAGLVTMVIVITAVNNSLGGAHTLPLEAVAIIIGVDRIVDMCRTTVNVWGDAVGAKIMTRIAPDTENEIAAARS